ncbi:hypothetical protein Tco_0881595 [Tanacetum coccineum]
MVLALEQSKTAQDLVINKLQKKVKRLEKALRARTLGMKLFKIGTSRRKGLDKENVSKQGRKSDKTKPMFKDNDFDVLDDAMENVEDGSTAEQITTAGDTLNTASINVSAAGPSTKEPKRATPVPIIQSQDKGKGKMVEPEPTPKNPRKAQIQMDEELAQRLFEEEQAQFEREQRVDRERAAEQEAKDATLIEQMEDVQARMDADELLAARFQEQEREQFSIDEQARLLVETVAVRKKFFVDQRAAEIRNRPPTRTQLRNQMITYLKHMGNYTHNQLKSKSFEEIQKLYKKEQQWINDFVPMSDASGKKDDSSSKQAESSKKRPRAEHDEESIKKQKLQDDAENEELRACLDIYQIIKADGCSKNYKIFSEMLDDFDRQEVMDLHRLVNERYDITSPEGYDLLLWGELKTLFEPCEEDEVWRNQQGYNLISCRLFDSCGVHVLLMDNGISIYMMIESKYPLTQEMLSRMLNRRLEVDHESKMAFKFLRFTRSQLKK